MKESEFQGWVIDVFRLNGWRVWHVPTPMKPVGGNRFVPDARGAGLPDLFMLRRDPSRMVLAECKVDTPISDGQREFLELARPVAQAVRELARGAEPGSGGCPVAVYVFRPGLESLIEAVARGAEVGA